MTIIDEQEIAAPQDSESDIVLSVNGVSKKFCRDLKRSLMYGVQDISSELLGLRSQSDTLRKKEFWALNNVSFQLRRGEALGLVGKNGSGKSTLLRIIAGLIKLDTGCVEVNGRVAPLIALGAGFNPILSGRENIYANMAILGLSKKEIDERFDEVIEFAEIGDAIEAPVQTYSSGMAARLGFATAIHTEPDILLIDEVLAVGDSRFQAKCFRKLHELRQKNTSFILVSHDSHSVLTVCESAVYLNQGKVLGLGDTASIISQYEEELFSNRNANYSKSTSSFIKPQLESSGFDINSIFFRDERGRVIESPTSGEATYFCIGCEINNKIDDVRISLVINRLAEGGELILLMNSFSDKQSLNFLPGKYEIRVFTPYLGLRLGVYNIDVYAKRDGLYHLDSIESFRFKVKSKESLSRGLFYQPRNWQVVSE